MVGKVYRGEETRYDVQVIHTYRNSYRLEHREFIWAPNLCDCPHLEVGRQYILMVRRHINYEHTLNRILLEEDSYVVPYRPREDEQLRQHEKLCGNRGHKHAEQSWGSSWRVRSGLIGSFPDLHHHMIRLFPRDATGGERMFLHCSPFLEKTRAQKNFTSLPYHREHFRWMLESTFKHTKEKNLDAI